MPISFTKATKAAAEAFEWTLGLPIGETSPDGMVTLEWTSDIGIADQEAAALINGTVLTTLTPADVPAIATALRMRGRAGDLRPFPNATERPNLVQAGPLLSGPRERDAGTGAVMPAVAVKHLRQLLIPRVTRKRGACAQAGLPPGDFPRPLLGVAANCITVRGSSIGMRRDMAGTLAFAADGHVHAGVELQPLPAVNDVFQRLAQGDAPSRVVPGFSA